MILEVFERTRSEFSTLFSIFPYDEYKLLGRLQNLTQEYDATHTQLLSAMNELNETRTKLLATEGKKSRILLAFLERRVRITFFLITFRSS